MKLKVNVVTGRNEVLAKVIILHLSVIHSVHRGGVWSPRGVVGGGVCRGGSSKFPGRGGFLQISGGGVSNFFGQCCLQFFGGGLQFFRRVLQFFRGGRFLQIFRGSPIFSGVPPNLRRGGSSKFLGVLQIFGGLQFLGGVSTGIRSMFSQYTSYWNAFLFFIWFTYLSTNLISHMSVGINVFLSFPC